MIVAWNVTEDPACGTNGVFASAVVLERLLTVCTTLSELDLKFALPRNAASTWWTPALRLGATRVASPPVSATGAPVG